MHAEDAVPSSPTPSQLGTEDTVNAEHAGPAFPQPIVPSAEDVVHAEDVGPASHPRVDDSESL